MTLDYIDYLWDWEADTASQFIWTDGGGTEHTIYVVGVDDTGIHVEAKSEEGTDWPPQSDLIEQTPDAFSNQYRGSTYGTRIYSYGAIVENAIQSNYERLLGNFRGWHNPTLGQGVVKRITAEGLVRCLDAIPIPRPKPSPLWDYGTVFRQSYKAATPWWRTETTRMIEGTFDPTDRVDLEWENLGAVPAYPIITITGVGTNPRVDNQAGKIMQVLYTTTNADDVIVIDTRRNVGLRRAVKFYENGMGNGVYISMSSASSFWTLPIGTSAVILRIDAGSPACDFEAYDYYGSLF